MSNGLIIALIISGYVVMWIITGVMAFDCVFEFDGAIYASFMGLFWPLTLPSILVAFIINDIGDRVFWHRIEKKYEKN